MKSICNLKPKQAAILRIVVWTSVIIAMFWVADIADRPIQTKTALKTQSELKTKLARMWLAQCTQVDQINQMALAITNARELKPGDPLPPSEIMKAILRKNPNKAETIGAVLDSEKPIHIKTWNVVTNKSLTTPSETILSIMATVPEKGGTYAATAQFANNELIPNGNQLHPNTPAGRKLVSDAIEATGGLGIPPKENVAKPENPNP